MDGCRDIRVRGPITCEVRYCHATSFIHRRVVWEMLHGSDHCWNSTRSHYCDIVRIIYWVGLGTARLGLGTAQLGLGTARLGLGLHTEELCKRCSMGNAIRVHA